MIFTKYEKKTKNVKNRWTKKVLKHEWCCFFFQKKFNSLTSLSAV